MSASSSDSRLMFAGQSVSELADRFGTPLYVLDEQEIRDNCERYRRAFARLDGVIAYSAKAFFCGDMGRIVREQELWLDVNSGGELTMALRAGVDPATIIMHGNNKTAAELELGLAHDVGRICVDSEWELDLLERVAERSGRIARILLRVAPGVSADTHDYVRTGDLDSKFGLPIDGGSAARAAMRAWDSPHLNLSGLHAHVGSQLMTSESVCLGARRLISFARELTDRGIQITDLDIGGGLGVCYRDEQPVSIEQFADEVSEEIERGLASNDIAVDRIIIEPGRSVVAECGIVIYRVGGVKLSPNGKRYVSVDGGMADNPRPSLYGASYRAELADRGAEPCTHTYDVVGRFCESGDVLVADCRLPDPVPGDLLVMYSAGAYQVSMASNYNLVPRPAVVMVGTEGSRLSVRRETYEDLLVRDVRLAPTTAGRLSVASPD